MEDMETLIAAFGIPTGLLSHFMALDDTRCLDSEINRPVHYFALEEARTHK